jgi:hypothetical protein
MHFRYSLGVPAGMPDALVTTVKGDWRQIADLAPEYGYENPLAFKRWLQKIGVAMVPIHRLPHARPSDIQQALERLAERSIDAAPRRRGRPRLTA